MFPNWEVFPVPVKNMLLRNITLSTVYVRHVRVVYEDIRLRTSVFRVGDVTIWNRGISDFVHLDVMVMAMMGARNVERQEFGFFLEKIGHRGAVPNFCSLFPISQLYIWVTDEWEGAEVGEFILDEDLDYGDPPEAEDGLDNQFDFARRVLIYGC